VGDILGYQIGDRKNSGRRQEDFMWERGGYQARVRRISSRRKKDIKQETEGY
jgi:hypothetical protein